MTNTDFFKIEITEWVFVLLLINPQRFFVQNTVTEVSIVEYGVTMLLFSDCIMLYFKIHKCREETSACTHLQVLAGAFFLNLTVASLTPASPIAR